MHCALISICARLARMRSRSNLAAVRRRRQARARPLCRGVIGVLLLHDRPTADHRHREALPASIFAQTCAPGRPHLSPLSLAAPHRKLSAPFCAQCICQLQAAPVRTTATETLDVCCVDMPRCESEQTGASGRFRAVLVDGQNAERALSRSLLVRLSAV